MLRVDIRKRVGRFFTEWMRAELTGFLGRKRYERHQKPSNYLNGSYERSITLMRIGEVTAKVTRDRLGTSIEPTYFLVAVCARWVLRKT